MLAGGFPASLSSLIHSSFAKDKVLVLSPHSVKPAERSAVTGEREVTSGAPQIASPSSRVTGESLHKCLGTPHVCQTKRLLSSLGGGKHGEKIAHVRGKQIPCGGIEEACDEIGSLVIRHTWGREHRGARI